MRALVPILSLAPLFLPAEQPVTFIRLLRTSTTWDGDPIRYDPSPCPEVQAVLMEIAPGGTNPWHSHPVNAFVYILEGDFRVELENHTSRDFHKGDAYAQVVEAWHQGSNIGKGPVKALIFFTGEAGAPTATPMLSPCPVTGEFPAPPSR